MIIHHRFPQSGSLSSGDVFSNSINLLVEQIPWSPPPKGFLKLNVDVAKTSGLGEILRDEAGSVLGSFQDAAGPGPPTLMELKAIKQGLIFFDSFRWCFKERLIIESDSKLFVEWIKNLDKCPGVFVTIVKDIINRLRVLEGLIRWVARTANIEADGLAKSGIG
ncbi:uncharacterized protein LOC120148053 [Hibiscus syriacus]|uniref:uncharacterized protein LOC120148053 n=1 Tax=Hibiscus syriacus TaxID=106335 RepID=UPI0019225F22|nr:uncharacterized protein LOC120148053 [Hibiscus syriacus]